jgi:hypothetical protein
MGLYLLGAWRHSWRSRCWSRRLALRARELLPRPASSTSSTSRGPVHHVHALGRRARRRGLHDGLPRDGPAHRAAAAHVPRHPLVAEGARGQRRRGDGAVPALPRGGPRALGLLSAAASSRARTRSSRSSSSSSSLRASRASSSRACSRPRCRRSPRPSTPSPRPRPTTTGPRWWARRTTRPRLLRAGRAFSLVWAVLLIFGRHLFIPLSRGTAAVEVALGIASLVYGGLLGAFALGVLTKRPGQAAAIVGIASGIGAVTLLRDQMAWPWYALVGSAITFVVGSAIGALGPAPTEALRGELRRSASTAAARARARRSSMSAGSSSGGRRRPGAVVTARAPEAAARPWRRQWGRCGAGVRRPSRRPCSGQGCRALGTSRRGWRCGAAGARGAGEAGRRGHRRARRLPGRVPGGAGHPAHRRHGLDRMGAHAGGRDRPRRGVGPAAWVTRAAATRSGSARCAPSSGPRTDGKGPPSCGTTSCARSRSAEPAELVPWAASASKAEVAGLVPIVVRAAANGDPAASQLMDEAVRELTKHVTAIVERMGPWPSPPRSAPLGRADRAGRAPAGEPRPRELPPDVELRGRIRSTPRWEPLGWLSRRWPAPRRRSSDAGPRRVPRPERRLREGCRSGRVGPSRASN